MCVHICWGSLRSQDSVRSSETEVAGGCEPSNVCAASLRRASDLNFWLISPAQHNGLKLDRLNQLKCLALAVYYGSLQIVLGIQQIAHSLVAQNPQQIYIVI